ELTTMVKDYASPRYQEGYEKGVHDHDAAKILKQLLDAYSQAPLLMFDPSARAIATYYWISQQDQAKRSYFKEQVQTAHKITTAFGSRDMNQNLLLAIKDDMHAYYEPTGAAFSEQQLSQAAAFMFDYLTVDVEAQKFQTSSHAVTLVAQLKAHLESKSEYKKFQQQIKGLSGSFNSQWQLIGYWLKGLIHSNNNSILLQRYVNEAIVLMLCDDNKWFDSSAISLSCEVDQLLGDHPNIKDRKLSFEFDEFVERLSLYDSVIKPQFQSYRSVKQHLMQQQKAQMALETFKARPLSSFVRNQLINNSYLPIIGDNLAKQMGALGQDKRSDLMGLLLLISPPGYGKTTLMEYTANRLGLNFMKINCPSLGHEVKSLDPANAPNATAKQELDKLNLALEMGNNVMLYLDDIQHTHPEFLQKFISLCDGTRKIEGVWKDQSKTYDMRGKKFCVIMAGNPYTESGEVFRVPDMLANRADVYNLGDVLSGQEDVFAMSYIENSLTSSPVLAPLALRDLNDLYLLMDMAHGKEIATADLSHSYATSEINEITTVLKSLFKVQDVILKVNQEYIRSAAMDDRYREEPPFKLQGSYRNMNKLAEKVVAVMDEAELQLLLDDHYVGEAQLLTTGAEENLLKLKELRGTLSEAEATRWQEIKKEFKIRNALAGDDADGATKIASQLAALKNSLGEMGAAISSGHTDSNKQSAASLKLIAKQMIDAINQLKLEVSVINEPLPGLDESLASLSETLETSFVPIIMTMNKKLSINSDVLEKVTDLSKKIQSLSQRKTARTVTQASSSGSHVTKKKVAKKKVAKKKMAKKVTKKKISKKPTSET
ncbi:MAG: ATP-binding protein, partial [Marinicella sp.]